MSEEVWVYAEHTPEKLHNVSGEILGAARGLAERLGGDVCAVIMGYDVERYAQELIYQGADKVYVVDDELFRDYNNELYTKALEKIVREHDPAIMLFGSVFDRRDLAPRVL